MNSRSSCVAIARIPLTSPSDRGVFPPFQVHQTDQSGIDFHHADYFVEACVYEMVQFRLFGRQQGDPVEGGQLLILIHNALLEARYERKNNIGEPDDRDGHDNVREDDAWRARKDV